jgi:NADH-quinone oxidoreductase subunit E
MLSEAARARIDREVAKYPADQKQSAVMSALAIVQDEQGWISPETIVEVAAYLGMPPVAVEEVATFYSSNGSASALAKRRATASSR